MKLTKQNHKACLNVINLLKKIIKNNLPYDQNYVYQSIFNINYVIADWDTLIASKNTCCLMGYLIADKKFHKADGYIYNSTGLGFKTEFGISAFDSYVGFNCNLITTKGDKSALEVLDWFVNTYANILKKV